MESRRSASTRSSAADWIASARSATRSPSSPPTRRTHGSRTWVVTSTWRRSWSANASTAASRASPVADRRRQQRRHQLVMGEVELVADIDQDRAVRPVDRRRRVDTVAVDRRTGVVSRRDRDRRRPRRPAAARADVDRRVAQIGGRPAPGVDRPRTTSRAACRPVTCRGPPARPRCRRWARSAHGRPAATIGRRVRRADPGYRSRMLVATTWCWVAR